MQLLLRRTRTRPHWVRTGYASNAEGVYSGYHFGERRGGDSMTSISQPNLFTSVRAKVARDVFWPNTVLLAPLERKGVEWLANFGQHFSVLP